MRIILASIPLLICGFLSSCSYDPVIKEELPSDNIYAVVPEGWPAPQHQFSDLPLTREKFILGRRLFYDTRLSRDNRVSCGSCHQAASAFADEGDAFSFGSGAMQGQRNSPALFNLNWQTSFMWDGAFEHLHQQPLAPITDPSEMNETMERILLKLLTDTEYKRLCKSAYGREALSQEIIFSALSQFMGMLVSHHSRYDDHLRGAASLSEEEMNGLSLFQSNCGSCHPPPLFSNFEYINNGLDSVFNDPGRAGVTMLAADSGKFKVPSLRNIALSPPYMHDGRFLSLAQVLDHYSSGIHSSGTLHPTLLSGIPLSSLEKQEIIAFLKTLTDQKFIRDKRFADPFNN